MSDDTETLTASPFEIAPALKEGEDTGSVRMGPFKRLYESLFAEALESGRVTGIFRQEFKGDVTAEMEIFSAINDTHTAAAQLGEDAIVRNSLANEVAGTIL